MSRDEPGARLALVGAVLLAAGVVIFVVGLVVGNDFVESFGFVFSGTALGTLAVGLIIRRRN